MSTQTIESRVRAGLTARRGDWKQVAQAAGVSYSWISKFMNGHIPNPGTRTLSRLVVGLQARSSPKKPKQEASHA
ncbi:XRE family transcriptional regulator [Bordetella phage vB_BaM-IFTN4]|nr:XRE family transcriptional regulator [Bordetella phage vB_BaM-IFTN4]